jgi:hypothetical protein
MSSFLNGLAARALGRGPALQIRVRSLFEPESERAPIGPGLDSGVDGSEGGAMPGQTSADLPATGPEDVTAPARSARPASGGAVPEHEVPGERRRPGVTSPDVSAEPPFGRPSVEGGAAEVKRALSKGDDPVVARRSVESSVRAAADSESAFLDREVVRKETSLLVEGETSDETRPGRARRGEGARGDAPTPARQSDRSEVVDDLHAETRATDHHRDQGATVRIRTGQTGGTPRVGGENDIGAEGPGTERPSGGVVARGPLAAAGSGRSVHVVDGERRVRSGAAAVRQPVTSQRRSDVSSEPPTEPVAERQPVTSRRRSDVSSELLTEPAAERQPVMSRRRSDVSSELLTEPAAERQPVTSRRRSDVSSELLTEPGSAAAAPRGDEVRETSGRLLREPMRAEPAAGAAIAGSRAIAADRRNQSGSEIGPRLPSGAAPAPGARPGREPSGGRLSIQIGRIEVRAVLPDPVPAAPAAPLGLSLDDYLQRFREKSS